MEQRLKRAQTQSLKLLESKDDCFKIAGMTSNYTVCSQAKTCTCVDFKRRKQACKHVYYVMLNVFNISANDILRGSHGNKFTKHKLSSDCSICMEPLREGPICTQCCHGFHSHCLDHWLRKNSTCPLCRFQIKVLSHI